MKKILTAALVLASFQAAAEIKPLNSVAAEVNSTVITHNDVVRAATLLQSNPANRSIAQADLFKVAKSQLIEQALLVDAAKNAGLTATPAEVDTEIARRAAIGKTTVADVYRQAASIGVGRDAYRVEVAKALLVERMMNNMTEGIHISDGQIQAYINQAQKDKQILPNIEPFTVYQVRRILLKINDQAKPSAVGARMKLIAQAIQQGSDFGTLAKRHSQEPAAAKNGLMEINEQAEPEKVEQVLQTLAVGQTSLPIQTAKNWQLIQMVGKRTETDPIKLQHEAIRRILVKKEQEKAQAMFMGSLQHNTVVREY